MFGNAGKPMQHFLALHNASFFSNAKKKLSYCRDSSRYGKIRDSGGSANRNRDPEYDSSKILFH